MSTPVMGVLRLVAALAVVMLGVLAVLVVLDILPRELLQTWGAKLLLVTGVIGVVALVVTILARQGPGQERLCHEVERDKP